MSIVSTLIKGMVSVITVTAAPQLYRYPYRSSAEGLRGDMSKVGGDIAEVLSRTRAYEDEDARG
ncbi:MAG: hypothetical protein JO089_01065 [Alphaproteobacteria bacterium]|nr:hypothetical protein [Alphaproteobacteria bacterium]